MLNTQQVLRHKRDGLALTQQQIKDFVDGIADQRVSQAQLAAFAMAVYIQGMSLRETTDLCCAMRDSGNTLSWDLPGPVVDKHSTGGVGDMVSLILGPILAACGAYVPMISGRGLGHSGGTIDKLESLPGYNANLSRQAFRHCVSHTGVCIIGQTAELAPADKHLYATRDLTATVESIPLITTSILSKKLAEGLDGLIMDIKIGNGAFMPDLASGQKLAESIIQVANAAGVKTHAVLTDMNSPLAYSAGNAVEIHECVEFLKGNKQHPALREVTLSLSAEALLTAGLVSRYEDGQVTAQASLDSGAAAEKFEQMLYLCGVQSSVLNSANTLLPTAKVVKPVLSTAQGNVAHINTRALGLCVVHLGGGRLQADQKIDPSVGLSQLPQLGDKIETGQPLAFIHAKTERDWQQAASEVRQAITVDNQSPVPQSRLLSTLRPDPAEVSHA